MHENLNRIERQVVIAHSDDGTAIVDVDLGVLNLDSTNIATITVRNGLGKSAEFHSASVDWSRNEIAVQGFYC